MRQIGICSAMGLAILGFGSSPALAASIGTAVEAPARTPPVYGYVGHAEKAPFRQVTPAEAVSMSPAFGFAGVVGIAVAGALIDQHGLDLDEVDPMIADSSEDMARAIANALADAKGGVLANTPIARDDWSGWGKHTAAQALAERFIAAVAEAADAGLHGGMVEGRPGQGVVEGQRGQGRLALEEGHGLVEGGGVVVGAAGARAPGFVLKHAGIGLGLGAGEVQLGEHAGIQRLGMGVGEGGKDEQAREHAGRPRDAGQGHGNPSKITHPRAIWPAVHE